MSHTYYKGYREGVVFSFVNDKRQALVEYRPVEEGTHIFFPSGSIEIKDTIGDMCYKNNALLREVDEEFNSSIKMHKVEYLNELYVDEVKLVFYIYLITEWQGEFPEYITEENEQASKLEWVDLEDYEEIFDFDSAKEISRRIIKHLDHTIADK